MPPEKRSPIRTNTKQEKQFVFVLKLAIHFSGVVWMNVQFRESKQILMMRRDWLSWCGTPSLPIYLAANFSLSASSQNTTISDAIIYGVRCPFECGSEMGEQPVQWCVPFSFLDDQLINHIWDSL